ncbi:RNA polymerase II degradation factor 1-like [Patiria miniata]|uniref:BEN domain-containing protein n=1 Tax=Patiria miniata TaxID=46514 RepID=A0A914AAI6_PATMI|nr:RNA polymerase II degradation factor 1-like [Patiria miniata]
MASVLVTWLEPEEKAGTSERVARNRVKSTDELRVNMTADVDVAGKRFKAIIVHIHTRRSHLQQVQLPDSGSDSDSDDVPLQQLVTRRAVGQADTDVHMEDVSATPDDSLPSSSACRPLHFSTPSPAVNQSASVDDESFMSHGDLVRLLHAVKKELVETKQEVVQTKQEVAESRREMKILLTSVTTMFTMVRGMSAILGTVSTGPPAFSLPTENDEPQPARYHEHQEQQARGRPQQQPDELPQQQQEERPNQQHEEQRPQQQPAERPNQQPEERPQQPRQGPQRQPLQLRQPLQPRQPPQPTVPQGGHGPHYVHNDDHTDNVVIGSTDGGSTLTLPRKDYESVYDKATCGKEIVVGLLPKAFTLEELSNFNYFGGSVLSGGVSVEKQSLRSNHKFKAIVMQAEREFPGCTVGTMTKDIRYAVNAKCRKASQKLRLT